MSGGLRPPARADLNLPADDFIYNAGKTERPWDHFVGRWTAMRPILKDMLRACDSSRPLRVLDVGSCTGYFSLQVAHWHPEADIVGIEGSVGVGNGRAGMEGSMSSILQTQAVQTHLHYIQKFDLSNCFVAPEVWDYDRVCELVQQGKPVGDVMFLLSIVHHIEGVSREQFQRKGFNLLDGTIDLMAKLLLLSPNHFIELPNVPWLQACFNAYGSARGILEAAAKASKRRWNFRGPIYQADWFGQREVWVLQVADKMPEVDVQVVPFPYLYRGDEVELRDDEDGNAADEEFFGPYGKGSFGAGALAGMDGFGDSARSGLVVDPGLMILADGMPTGPMDPQVGEAVNSASTELLLAHLALRDAINEAQRLLKQTYAAEALEIQRAQRAQQEAQQAQQAPVGARGTQLQRAAPHPQMIRSFA